MTDVVRATAEVVQRVTANCVRHVVVDGPALCALVHKPSDENRGDGDE